MNKKELIAKILAKMDESDLEDILGSTEETEEKPHHEIKAKRRGRGFNKKKKNSKRGEKSQSKIEQKPKEGGTDFVNKFDEMLNNMSLSAAESEEFKVLDKIDDTTTRAEKPKRSKTLQKTKCTVCGKEETVSQSLIIGNRYKCNACCCNAR